MTRKTFLKAFKYSDQSLLSSNWDIGSFPYTANSHLGDRNCITKLQCKLMLCFICHMTVFTSTNVKRKYLKAFCEDEFIISLKRG